MLKCTVPLCALLLIASACSSQSDEPIAVGTGGGSATTTSTGGESHSNPCDLDSDGDGIDDCEDQCPEDASKVEPGECGCGTPDKLVPGHCPIWTA